MGAFTLNGKVNQVGKDGVDVGIDQDKTVATGWTATLVSNYPKGVPIPDGSDIDYITTRTITLLADGSITEDGVSAGISLTAHDPDLFSTPLQWTIKPGIVTLADNKTLRPKPWTFNAPLTGVAVTLGGLTPVAGMPLLPVPGAVPWDDVTGKPVFVAAGDTAAIARAEIGAANVVPGYDVILLVGQSNMQGADNTKDSTIDVADGRIFEWPNSGSHVNTIQPAVDPLHHIGGASAEVGPGVPFARWYLSTLATGRKVLLIPAAYGGTGFEASDTTARWKVGRVVAGETNLYDNAVIKTNAAMAAAGPESRLAAILWCQGEADGSTAGATYQADLLALIDGFRSNITGAATAPFLILSMTPEQITGGNAGRVTINNVHVDTPYLRPLCGYAYGAIGQSGGASNVHYNAVGQRWNGSVALAAAYRRAVANQIGTAPNAPTGVTVTRNASVTTSVDVVWNQATGRVTDYAIEYRTADGEAWTALSRTRSLDTTATIPGLGLGNYVEVRVYTLNESGTSLPSTSGRLAMLPTPTVSVTQTLSDTVTVTTAAVLGSTTYRFDYKLTASSTWTIGTPQIGLSVTIGGLALSPYDFRVVAFTAIGAAVVTATSYTLGLLPINPASLTATIAQGYGLRKVVVGYAGNAIKVRRSSDNTELDIGFSGNNLDTAALLTFCGSGNGFVSKWYDQSGNTKDMLQATTANQPKIVSSGVLVTNNGRPGMDFDGATSYMERAAAEFYSSGAGTVCGVASGTITANLQECVFGEGGTGSNNARYFIMKESSGANARLGYNIIGDASGTDVLKNDFGDGSAADTFGATPKQWVYKDSGTAVTRYRGGSVVLTSASATSDTYSRSGKTLTLNRQSIGALHRLAVGTFALFRPSEFVVFNTAINDTDRGVVEANQKAYYGTPTGLA